MLSQQGCQMFQEQITENALENKKYCGFVALNWSWKNHLILTKIMVEGKLGSEMVLKQKLCDLNV